MKILFKGINITLIYVFVVVGCQAKSEEDPVNIKSDGGNSQFFEGQKPDLPPNSVSSSQTSSNQIDTYCPKALDSRLQIGDTAEVIVFQLSGRPTPGYDSYQERVLADGRVVEIVNGPRCVDDAWWWEVHFSGTVSSGEYLDFYAWMLEADYDTYYLQRVN